MSVPAANAFNSEIQAYNQRRAEKEMHDQSYETCRNILIKVWRVTFLPPVISDLNATLQVANLNLWIEEKYHCIQPRFGNPYIAYAMTRPGIAEARENVFPDLRLELREDLAAHSNVKDDCGQVFILPLAGTFEVDRLVPVFAAFLRDCLKRF